jgi:glycosyltransferase involved in cell wall biosynthesis
MPIIEANIVGRLVITSNCYSMPEVAGDAALIVNPYSIDEIRNGILNLIEDDEYRNQLINNGFKNTERFNLKSIAEHYLQLYNTIIKK